MPIMSELCANIRNSCEVNTEPNGVRVSLFGSEGNINHNSVGENLMKREETLLLGLPLKIKHVLYPINPGLQYRVVTNKSQWFYQILLSSKALLLYLGMFAD